MVRSCLSTLGVDPASCPLDLQSVRKAYIRAALRVHPDKPGGDAGRFREVHAAFEAVLVAARGCADLARVLDLEAESPVAVAPVRSASFYEEAAKDRPSYQVAVARTDRARCASSGQPISRGELKVGCFDAELGDYGRFRAVRKGCFRVPNALQACLRARSPGSAGDHASTDAEQAERDLLDADGLVLAGFAALSAEDRAKFARFVADGSNWARKSAAGEAARAASKAKLCKRKAGPEEPEARRSKLQSVARSVPLTALKGLKFVLSGTFDEEACGVRAGKSEITERLLGLGATVTGALSKKSSALLVGSAPGASKLAMAAKLGVPVIDLAGLERVASGECSVHDAGPAQIAQLSAGFGGNGIATRLTNQEAHELVARATAAKPLALK